MKMRKLFRFLATGTILASAILSATPEAEACSRVLYKGLDSLFIVGRSLDWRTPIPTNLYVYPSGMEKKGSNSANAVTWKSRYGAVYAVGYDGGITEGMNEKGLVINGLFCKGTVYNNPDTQGKPPISMSLFVGWLLDMNATVDDVIDVLKAHEFTIDDDATFDGGTTSTLHWGVTDVTGRSIIFEFDHGNIRYYEMGDYRAMTNDPQWPEMTAIIDYWNKKGGTHTLPGTMSSPDRCVRANFFAHSVEPVNGFEEGLAITRSILIPESVPYTYTVQGEPNLSSTQWRSYADVRDRKYAFEIVTNPGTFWIDLRECDLRPGARVLRLDTSRSSAMIGDVTKWLKKAEPFTPMM